jgi:hypothetical protein
MPNEAQGSTTATSNWHLISQFVLVPVDTDAKYWCPFRGIRQSMLFPTQKKNERSRRLLNALCRA